MKDNVYRVSCGEYAWILKLYSGHNDETQGSLEETIRDTLSIKQFIYIIPSVDSTVCFDKNSIIKWPGYLIPDTLNLHIIQLPTRGQLPCPISRGDNERHSGQENWCPISQPGKREKCDIFTPVKKQRKHTR